MEIIAWIIGLVIGWFIGQWICRWQKREQIKKSKDFEIAKNQLTHIVSGVGEMLAKDYEEQGDPEAAKMTRKSFKDAVDNIKLSSD